jgi:hypothetical protein
MDKEDVLAYGMPSRIVGSQIRSRRCAVNLLTRLLIALLSTSLVLPSGMTIH